ncbi:diguanylate cyclase [Haloimpatiens sp. FM7330]|uniref:sensor domain-containing diguanylate cyclase n=1 Tax=Haloimpatiens sp. FM7330 TaxID=3298610 RepID=UPI00362CA704
MEDYSKILEKYNQINSNHKKVLQEFQSYQRLAENTIKVLTNKKEELEKRLDVISNVLEVGRYINSNISNNDFISMINDMIIGVIGVTYSSIYLSEDDKLVLKASNVKDNEERNNKINKYYDKGYFIMNCKDEIFKNIHSIIGVPINIYMKNRGFILMEHELYNFFDFDQIKFISSISNQIAIALENNLLYQKVRESSLKDSLLGIYNRRYFYEVVNEKICNIRQGDSFAIVMIDIDDFKKINDTYGHLFGDKVLIKIVDIITNNIGENNIVARYGGEELLVYIDNYKSKSCVCDKLNDIRHQISCNPIKYNGYSQKVTASFGISYCPYNGTNLEKLIGVADKMLYKAKQTGKNKIVSA